MDVSNAKRKKRKTRKCLDEIRKRSRRAGQSLIDNHNGKVCDKYTNNLSDCKNFCNCIITNKRLTLQVFPKAIRSETITRPILEDLKQKPFLNVETMVTDSKIRNVTLNNIEEKVSLFNNNENNTSDNECIIERRINVLNNINNNQDKVSRDVDNSNYLENNDNSPESIGAQSVTTLTTPSAPSLNSDCSYNLYEELISEIPSYLERNGPCVEEDVMKNTKYYLQNLIIDNRYDDCGQKFLRCVRSNKTKMYNPREMSQIIVHNPLDLIRLSHAQKQSFVQEASPAQQVGSVSGDSEQSASSPAASSASAHDTPDYTYYPHRLN